MYTTFLLYYSSSKFSKFIHGKSPLLQQLASVSLLKEKSKIYPNFIELLSWNGPTVDVCCFMLERASNKTFVSRIHIRQRSQKTATEIFVSRKSRQQGHSLTQASLQSLNLTLFTVFSMLRPLQAVVLGVTSTLKVA